MSEDDLDLVAQWITWQEDHHAERGFVMAASEEQSGAIARLCIARGVENLFTRCYRRLNPESPK